MSMNYENDELIDSSLGAMIATMEDNPSIFNNHLHTILQRLMKIAVRESNGYHTRISISRMFGIICKDYYEQCNLSSHKKKVFKILGVLVGDKKRGVRSEAAKSRLLWHLQS